MTSGSPPPEQDSNVVETIQSLIVAFVLAMTFRGFVTEGFVIPTGSMAPTLLGQHALLQSPQTGYTFATGIDAPIPATYAMRIADPMLGEKYPGTGVSEKTPGSGIPRLKRPIGMGDRILVLKTLYPFNEPDRFDVVVFKNPTDPVGDKSNYIKRLIGLPNEKVWLADGDVFARPFPPGTTDDVPGQFETFAEYRVQRKPLYIQRAVWQTVYNSDFAPMHLQRLLLMHRFDGPPWVGDDHWDTTINHGRTYVTTSSEPTSLTWDQSRRVISDWTPYNMVAYMSPQYNVQPHVVNDVRVSAGVVAAQHGLKMTLELETRSHVFQFTIEDVSSGAASTRMRMRPVNQAESEGGWIEKTGSVKLPAPGKPFNVEFWHVDQAMHMFIDGKPACETLEYEWSPLQRLRYATGNLDSKDIDMLVSAMPKPARIRWRFEGSPLTLHRVRLDRDLHYRHDILRLGNIHGHAFGTHPFSPEQFRGILGPDQFMMCGDNSQLSLDSRLWGMPHPLVDDQIDDSPFTVHRKMLIGKAWVVYFPAPYPIYENGRNVIPDFGRLRFIR